MKTNFEYIEYEYGDSSVPPEYHRSFKIRIDKDKLSIKVDSYGDILNEKEFPLSEKDFKEILAAVKKINFKKKYPELVGCTGGVSKSFTFKTSASELHTSIYFCGGKPSEKATLEVDTAAKIIVSKIPDFEKQLMRDSN